MKLDSHPGAATGKSDRLPFSLTELDTMRYLVCETKCVMLLDPPLTFCPLCPADFAVLPRSTAFLKLVLRKTRLSLSSPSKWALTLPELTAADFATAVFFHQFASLHPLKSLATAASVNAELFR
jgi:hypothetical protein